MPVEEWMQKEAQGVLPAGDYEVTAIVDERRRRHARASEFIVKWKASRRQSHVCNIYILASLAAADFGCRSGVGSRSCSYYGFLFLPWKCCLSC